MSALNWIKQDIGSYEGLDGLDRWHRVMSSPDGQTIAISNYYYPILYLTYDSGDNWEVYAGLTNIPNPPNYYQLTNGSIMYAYTVDKTLYRHDRSTGETVEIIPIQNFGHRWYLTYNLKTDGTGQNICVTVYTNTITTSEYDGIYISNDYGATWSVHALHHNGIGGHQQMGSFVNSTGQYMAVLATGQLHDGENITHSCFYVSNDCGVTWNKKFDNLYFPGYRFSTDVAASDDLTHIYTVYRGAASGSQPKCCYMSHDSGDTWQTHQFLSDTSISTASITTDCTGQYIFYSLNASVKYISQDYGASWQSFSSTIYPTDTCIIPGGHDAWHIFPSGAYYVVNVSTDWFSTWTPLENPLAGLSLTGQWLTAVNSDGTKYLAALYNTGYPYISNGDGIWQKADIPGGAPIDIEFLTMSGDGQYVLLGGYDGLYLSINGGTTWNKTVPIAGYETAAWNSGAINYTGQYMLLGDYDSENELFSNDYGATWSVIDEGTGFVESACINNNGSVLVASGWGGIYISLNYGATWFTKDYNYGNGYIGLSCTAMGDTIYICDAGYSIWRSTNYGSDWTELTPNTDAYFSACSDKNEMIFFADTKTGLQSSSDGINWTQELLNAYSVSSDSSGTKIICGQENGYVYITPTGPINLDDLYSKKGHTHPYAPIGDYMINGHTIYPLNVRPTGSYYSSAGELGAGTGIPYVLRLVSGGTMTLTVRGGIVTYIG